jgi:hypothetical protein
MVLEEKTLIDKKMVCLIFFLSDSTRIVLIYYVI